VRVGNSASWEHRVQFFFGHKLENGPVIAPSVGRDLFLSPYVAVTVKIASYVYVERFVYFSPSFLDGFLDNRYSLSQLYYFS
jgi:hypothetical protein